MEVTHKKKKRIHLSELMIKKKKTELEEVIVLLHLNPSKLFKVIILKLFFVQILAFDFLFLFFYYLLGEYFFFFLMCIVQIKSKVQKHWYVFFLWE